MLFFQFPGDRFERRPYFRHRLKPLPRQLRQAPFHDLLQRRGRIQRRRLLVQNRRHGGDQYRFGKNLRHPLDH